MEIYYKYFHKYKYLFFAGVACVTMEAVCDLLGPTLMARIIDEGIERGQVSQVLHWGVIMLIVTAFGAVFAVSRNVLASSVSQRMGADLRADLFSKIVNFSETSADKIEGGSLITRLTNDTTQVVQFVNGIMRIFLKAPVTCIGSIILASMLNLRLSLIIYGVVAIVSICIIISMKLSYPRFSKLQKAMDKVNRVMQEYLIGVRLVKAFGTYDEERERFRDANSTLMQRGISSQIVITMISPILNFTVGVGTVLVIYIGSRLFSMSMTGAGDVSAFTIYMSQILSSLLTITNVFNTFVRTKASTSRIKEILDSEEDFAHGGGGEKLEGNVRFEDVTFAYPGGSGLPVLKNLSFSIDRGQNLAIIGPTGSGKSTIAWLLLRFYDVDSGKITIDGRGMADMDVDTVRDNVALVPQKSMLFSGSVEENIRWGREDAPRDQVEEAARKAQADFVRQMECGFDSMLGSAGVNLSGGQRQRLSIARGLIKEAPILILDDATSALDAVTEAKVRRQLAAEKENRTIITITQRCTTAMFADKILVMEDGSSVGFGSHQELLESCEVYREIYRSQVESR